MTWFSCQGNDADFVYYTTPSRSRGKKEHDVVVDKRTGYVTCTCEDAVYGKKFGYLLDPIAPHACWHVKTFLQTVGAILSRALGRVA